METATPPQNVSGLHDATALAACLRLHLALTRNRNGIAFVSELCGREHADARRLLHAFHAAASTRSILATPCESSDGLEHLPDELIVCIARQMGMRSLFNFARSCKRIGHSLWKELVLETHSPLRQHVEDRAVLPHGFVLGASMCEFDSALAILAYLRHSLVHRFRCALVSQPCLNALANLYNSGGVRRTISAVEVRSPGHTVPLPTIALSPSGAFVLYVDSETSHIALVERYVSVDIPRYTTVVSEEFAPGLCVGVEWPATGPSVTVYNKRSQKTVLACVSACAR